MLLSRLGIRSRIYGGMAILIILGLALAGQGVWQLTAIAGQVARLSALSDNNTRVPRIAGLLETTRRGTNSPPHRPRWRRLTRRTRPPKSPAM